MAIGNPHNVQVSLNRQLTPVEHEYVEDLLDRAERVLSTQVNMTRVDSEPNFAAIVADIEGDMVARVFRAGGSAYLSESEGDYSYRLNTYAANTNLVLLPEELKRLGVSQYGTVSTIPDYAAGGAYFRCPDWWYAWPD